MPTDLAALHRLTEQATSSYENTVTIQVGDLRALLACADACKKIAAGTAAPNARFDVWASRLAREAVAQLERRPA